MLKIRTLLLRSVAVTPRAAAAQVSLPVTDHTRTNKRVFPSGMTSDDLCVVLGEVTPPQVGLHTKVKSLFHVCDVICVLVPLNTSHSDIIDIWKRIDQI